ncbi:radical SAM protein [Roseomonas nepalensis]|uniref:Radical SAM protein n=1 Tax=Muricoccus nepalensis TaxID=1854500 RepID=A0A502FK45_9PROT|nr:radical SAM protein [Roseomonas nepalensis]TPG49887.1 radical SAM protein [Roseomonas nepalensis]
MTHLSAITPARPSYLSQASGGDAPARDARLSAVLSLMETGGLFPQALPGATAEEAPPAWTGTSPGLDLGAPLPFTPDFPARLERKIGERGDASRPVLLGAGTDPYQPVERILGVTRAALEVLDRLGHPVTLVTKSTSVLRDLDILGRLAGRGLLRVCFPVATLDHRLARLLEPRAPTPLRRLAVMHELSRHGIPVAVVAGPMIPGVNDAEMEKVLEAAQAHGARAAAYVLLRLAPDLRRAVEAWLNAQMPDRAARVLALIRGNRAGRPQDARPGLRPLGVDTAAEALARRFAAALPRLGLDGAQAGAALPAADRQPVLL